MEKTILNLDNARTNRDVLIAIRRAYPGKQVSESSVRLDAEIINTSRLTWEINSDAAAGTNTKTASERRLQRNDIFIATGLRFGIKKVVSDAHAQALVYTYPNSEVFASDNTGNTFVNADLEALWNSFIQVKNGSTVNIEALPTQQCRWSPENAKGTINAAAVVSSTITTYKVADDPRPSRVGYIDLSTYLMFRGVDQNEISLTIPNGAALKIQHVATSTKNFAVLEFEGFLVKNAIIVA